MKCPTTTARVVGDVSGPANTSTAAFQETATATSGGASSVPVSELMLTVMRAHRSWAKRHAPHLLEEWLS